LLRERLPGLVAIVFMLCMTSFAVVLTLGGGPAATTVEVAIYQALRFDYDPARAALLGLLQLAISALVVLLSLRWTRPFDLLASAGKAIDRPDTVGWSGRSVDGFWIAAAAFFLMAPMAAVLVSGLAPAALPVWMETKVWMAALRSLAVAASAGMIAVAIALALQMAIRVFRRRGSAGVAAILELAGSIVLGLSPLAFGAGLFLLLVGIVGPFRWSLAPVVLLSAFLALPYAMRLVGPPLMQSARLHDRLCASLGIAGWYRWRLVEWPTLRPAIGFALALSVTLAVGDLASIALFGSPEDATLPLLLYQLLGSYRMQEAAGVAVLLLAMVMILFAGIERGVGGRTHIGN